MCVKQERDCCLGDISFLLSKHWGEDEQLAPAIKFPPPSEWSAIMSRGENVVPLKSVLNQTQLIPLFSLIISTVDHVPLVSLLTRAWAPVKVMLGQAR